MKTTKKVLSIVLSVMLLVGMVVVGVSADTTMVYEKAGSKLVYSATADKTTTDDAGYILVQPGDEVTVSVYMQANYYIGTTGSEIFAWSTNFFEDVSLEDDISRHNFINSYTAANNKLVAENAAQLGGDYAKGGYVGYLYGRGYKDNEPGPFDASTPVLAYQFKFTVASTTADGATAEFVMPEPCSATVATNSRMRQIYAAVNNSATEYGSSSLASQYPETIDLSATLLKFKVGTAATLGEIKSVDAASAIIGDTAVVAVDVTGSPESLRVTTPSGEKTFARDDATIETTTDGEQWLIEVVAEDESTDCTVYANYGTLGETEGYAFTITGYEYCSYTLLETAVLYCSELDAEEEYYDPTDLQTWKDALATAQALLADKDSAPLVKTDENQAKLDDAANALTEAYENLYEIYLDLTPLYTAIGNCSNPAKAPEFYDVDAYAAWQAALAAAKEAVINYDAAPDTEANRNAVATLASDLETKFAALDPQYVNLDALNKAVTDCATPAYAAEYYDADAYAAWQAALAAAQAGLTTYAEAANTAANRDAVAALAADLEAAYDELDARFVDVTPLENVIAESVPAYADEYYDATALATFKQEVMYANQIVTSYKTAADTEANRQVIAMYVDNVTNAYNALVPQFVDVSELETIIADSVPEYGAEYYDVDAWAAFQAAIAAGNDLVTEFKGTAPDTEANRDEVSAAIGDISTTFYTLIPQFIDYSALEDAVAAYGTTPEAADAYTAETYDPYAAALARANDMLANKNENAPYSDTELAAQIAAAASELESTFKALELAHVDAIVTNVTAKQEFYKVGDTVNFDFLCSVTNVTKLQIVYANGSTVTYHRGHSAVTVVDNGDGTETWTIATRIYYDEATATAKAKLGNVWEENGYKFNIKTKSDEDYSVKSAEVLLNDVAVTEFTTNDTVVIKIVCGPSTVRMRLVDQSNGATSTYGRSKATQDVNGNWIWLITRKAGAGAYAYDIYTTGGANRLVDEGTDLTYTVTAPVVVVGPSTGNDADIVVSATVAKARILRGNEQTFTVVTDKNAGGVRVVDQYGVVQVYSKDVATAIDNGDNTLTWVLTVACGHADTYKCDVEALYGSSWMSNDTTVTYKVVY